MESFMKKIVAFVVVLIMTISLSAQFKTGMAFRTRAEMFSTNEDVQVWRRIADLRFNPYLSYTQNEYLSAKLVFEIGDIGFGNKTQGGALGTDGLNVETKNLFLQLTPNKENTIVLGLQPYKDFHSLLLDADIAGLSWKNKYMLQGKELTSYLAWFVSEDKDEQYVDESTYSFGNTEIVADFEYQINDKMKVGVNNIVEFVRKEVTTDLHLTGLNMWSAPYFAGTFNKFYMEAVLGLNNIRPDYESPEGTVEIEDGEYQGQYSPEHSGIMLSLKTKYDINEEVATRFNFIFRDGDKEYIGGYTSYYGIKSYYNSGLEILTESGCGLDKIDEQVFSPITSYPNYPGNTDINVINGHAGIILPAVFVDYNATKLVKDNMSFINNLKLTMGLGYAVTVMDILREGSDGIFRPETWIGTELDIKAEAKMYDELYFTPYLAILFPGEWYDYEGGHDPFVKVGLSLKTNIK
jgi:hypothetical protein